MGVAGNAEVYTGFFGFFANRMLKENIVMSNIIIIFYGCMIFLEEVPDRAASTCRRRGCIS
jgi:hypothetical protein